MMRVMGILLGSDGWMDGSVGCLVVAQGVGGMMEEGGRGGLGSVWLLRDALF